MEERIDILGDLWSQQMDLRQGYIDYITKITPEGVIVDLPCMRMGGWDLRCIFKNKDSMCKVYYDTGVENLDELFDIHDLHDIAHIVAGHNNANGTK